VYDSCLLMHCWCSPRSMSWEVLGCQQVATRGSPATALVLCTTPLQTMLVSRTALLQQWFQQTPIQQWFQHGRSAVWVILQSPCYSIG
jgi:hypothetical protein